MPLVERDESRVATLTRVGFLAEPMKSPFRGNKGKSTSGLIMASAHVDRENNRYGIVRNPHFRCKTKSINDAARRCIFLSCEAGYRGRWRGRADPDKRGARSRARTGILAQSRHKFEIQEGGELAQGQFKLLGTRDGGNAGVRWPNAAMSGTDPRELSGRAIRAAGGRRRDPRADRGHRQTVVADGLRGGLDGRASVLDGGPLQVCDGRS